MFFLNLVLLLLELMDLTSCQNKDILCIVGSVVECSPATRAARVRFPDDAILFNLILSHSFYIFEDEVLEIIFCGFCDIISESQKTRHKYFDFEK